MQIFSFRRRSSCLASRSTLLYHLISTLPTSSVRVIFTFGRCDICDRRSPLSRQNQWQLPLSVLGSIIATASCTALWSGTSTVSRRYRMRRLALCIRLPSRRVSRLCTNSCTGYRSDNGSCTSWRHLLSRRSTVGPNCIFTNSFETIGLPEHFDLLPLHCFTDHL